jgi:hypothetical protein
MNSTRKLLISLFLVLMIPVANATVVYVNVGRVTKVITYTTFGNTDVTVATQNRPPGCDGFWFRSNEPNGKEIFSQLMIAQQTQQALDVYAYDDQIWTGSASRFCRIYAVSSENP